MKRFLLLSAALSFAILGCSSADDGLSGETTEEVGASEDGLSGLALREVLFAAPAFGGTSETRKLFTSAAAFTAYFGVKPPAGIDFSKEWVAFYAAGMKPTGGYAARITRARVAGIDLIVSTRLEQPGKTCAVTMAITHPTTLVAFTKPGYAKWLRFTKYTKTNECDVGTCALMDCFPGTKCVEIAGEPECQPLPGSCGTMKCAAGTHCQDDASGKGSCIPDLGCAAVLCAPGTKCVENGGTPTCIPIITCANIKCAFGTHCQENNGSANCAPDLTCASMLCAPGSFCAEDQGFAACMPYSTCANVKCTSTTTCVDLPIQCIKAPCAPTAPQCVPGTFSCPTQKYVNCMPPTTNPACSNPEKTWIQAHCPGVQYVY